MCKMKNGFYCFESALHVFPVGSDAETMSLQEWNSDRLWRAEYVDLAAGCLFFAEDIFGVQFCFKHKAIQSFDPETGATTPFAEDLEDWARLILRDYDLYTGYGIAHAWQRSHGLLRAGYRLVPKIPFVMKGPFSLENLYELEAVKSMRFRASIALQIRNLPDGSRIHFKIVD